MMPPHLGHGWAGEHCEFIHFGPAYVKVYTLALRLLARYPLVSSAALLPQLLLSTAPVSPPRERISDRPLCRRDVRLYVYEAGWQWLPYLFWRMLMGMLMRARNRRTAHGTLHTARQV